MGYLSCPPLYLIMTEQKPNVLNSIKVALVSACGTWLGDTLLYPLDTISTRLKGGLHMNMDSLNFVWTSLRNEGRKLFRGVNLTFAAAFVPSFVYITSYDMGMKAVEYYLHKNTTHDQYKLIFPFFISSLSQILALMPYLPIDVVRTRVQMNKPEYPYMHLFPALAEIYEKQGFSRFYKSSRIFFVCKTLYTAIQFESFELIRYFVGPSYIWLIFNTLASTAISVTLLNPFEVLITRYALVDTTKNSLSFRGMIKKIYGEGGVRCFYKGYPTEILYNCSFALFWLPLYQIVRERFGIEVQQQ